jgi:ABC-2 type transport system ATP-binding protein
LTGKAIIVESLTKVYPRVKAVDDVSFSVESGEVFGLLGPNGAGKTTIIRILLTLTKPNSGKLFLFDIDGIAHPDRVRQMTGYVPQEVSLDGELTGYENILMYAKLYGVPGKERAARIKDILNHMGMQERAGDMASTYSGGMMRRLEIAQTLVNRPRVLFLDEPSIGLDPAAEQAIWELVKMLRDRYGTTIFLTTHDMNEADRLCDRIGIMERGKLVITGRPSALKDTVGGDVLTVSARTPGFAGKLKELGYTVASESPGGQVDLLVANGETMIPRVLDGLRSTGVAVTGISLKKPTLNDVFLKYTGSRIDDGADWKEVKRTRRTFRRKKG